MNFLELIPKSVQTAAAEKLKTLESSRVLITGGTGFWGTSLLYTLKELQALSGTKLQLEVLSRNPEAFQKKHPSLAKRGDVSFVKGDLQSLMQTQKNWDFVFHLAYENMESELKSHSLETANSATLDQLTDEQKKLSEFFQTRTKEKLLLASSGVMSQAQSSLKKSDYTVKKQILETAFSQALSKKLVIARGYATYGPFMNLEADFAVSYFMRALRNHSPIVIKSTGESKRGFMESADLSIWLLTLLVSGTEPVYEVGSDEAVTILQLAKHISVLANPPLEIQVGKDNSGDKQNYVPKIDSAKKLGLDVWTNLPQGLSRLHRSLATDLHRSN